jgi:hypothetical protein
MPKKLVHHPSDVYSSSDAIKFFEYRRSQGDNININKVGETQYEIAVPGKGNIHLNDNCKTLPKTQRNLVRFWIFCLLGTTSALILSAPLWLPEVLKVLAG